MAAARFQSRHHYSLNAHRARSALSQAERGSLRRRFRSLHRHRLFQGQRTPTSNLKGLRVYMADRASLPSEVLPPPSARKHWTRRGIAEWLVERLAEDVADAGRHRPRIFLSAALFLGASPEARLASLSRRLPASLADRRQSDLLERRRCYAVRKAAPKAATIASCQRAPRGRRPCAVAAKSFAQELGGLVSARNRPVAEGRFGKGPWPQPQKP